MPANSQAKKKTKKTQELTKLNECPKIQQSNIDPAYQE